ncbi:MAG TPA: hypothetical protein VMU59_09305 [Caulobacteraceae bacterium]|nr:hypothetical protein [Caulobacteraceae bacterium]
MSDPAQVKIVNTALFQLGQEPVADLSEASRQGSVALVKIMRVMEQARETVLERHGWLCALEYVTLTPAEVAGAAPNFRYPTTFLLPGDALQVWEIEGCRREDWGPRWQVGSVEAAGGASRKIIRAASSEWLGPCQTVDRLNVAYVRLANWASLTRQLADAVAFEMAARAAFSVTGDKGLMSALAKAAEDKIIKAIGADGTQEGGQPALAPSIPQRLRNLSR